jgi:hypothetical protein
VPGSNPVAVSTDQIALGDLRPGCLSIMAMRHHRPHAMRLCLIWPVIEVHALCGKRASAIHTWSCRLQFSNSNPQRLFGRPYRLSIPLSPQSGCFLRTVGMIVHPGPVSFSLCGVLAFWIRADRIALVNWLELCSTVFALDHTRQYGTNAVTIAASLPTCRVRLPDPRSSFASQAMYGPRSSGTWR